MILMYEKLEKSLAMFLTTNHWMLVFVNIFVHLYQSFFYKLRSLTRDILQSINIINTVEEEEVLVGQLLSNWLTCSDHSVWILSVTRKSVSETVWDAAIESWCDVINLSCHLHVHCLLCQQLPLTVTGQTEPWGSLSLLFLIRNIIMTESDVVVVTSGPNYGYNQWRAEIIK